MKIYFFLGWANICNCMYRYPRSQPKDTREFFSARSTSSLCKVSISLLRSWCDRPLWIFICANLQYDFLYIQLLALHSLRRKKWSSMYHLTSTFKLAGQFLILYFIVVVYSSISYKLPNDKCLMRRSFNCT